MDLAKLGKDLLASKLGDAGAGGLMESLSKLTGGGEGNLDLGELVGQLQSGGLGEQVQSWLGDGDNAEVSAEQLTDALGADKIADVASGLGCDAGEAANQLKDLLPGLMDKASSGGNLLEQFGGASSALDLAKSLFK